MDSINSAEQGEKQHTQINHIYSRKRLVIGEFSRDVFEFNSNKLDRKLNNYYTK